MRTEEVTAMSSERAPSLPPALYLIRARPCTSKVVALDSPSAPCTPPFRSRVTVPFLWEDAPGKPKLRETAANARLPLPAATASCLRADGGVSATATSGSVHEDGARACPVPLKLPPRLQAAATSECSLSPKTVLQGPYFGGGGKKPPKPLRRSGSTASCRMKLGAGGGLLSWTKATAAAGKGGAHDHDAPAPDVSCCSSEASSASSSSSSSSMSYFFDAHGRGAHWRQTDGREDSEDGEAGEDGAKGSVRITRFRRNRSLPRMTRSHLWASIHKSVKQISPWS